MNSRLLLGKNIAEPKRWEVLSDYQAMQLAIQEAFKGAGQTSPNPLVGCVILDSKNRFLSKAYHEVLGGPHAEINALKALSPAEIKGSRVFVTLEPCAHEGRTPSCAKTLAVLPIQDVIFGLLDPNPLVAGQGANILKNAGIYVSSFVSHPNLEKSGVNYHLKSLPDDEKNIWNSLLEQTCEHFLWNLKKQAPFISIKVAASLDGQIALKNGESKWITGEDSRLFSHYLRGFHEATLVGAGTVLSDDPHLNIRHPHFQNKKNKIIVLDSQGRCLCKVFQLNLFKCHSPEDLIFIVDSRTDLLQIPAEIKESGITIISIANFTNQLDLHLVLKKLWDLKIKSILVEGGAKILSSFLKEKLAQRIYLFTAPVIIGAGNGRCWTENFSINSLNEKIKIQNQIVMPLGNDYLLSGSLSAI